MNKNGRPLTDRFATLRTVVPAVIGIIVLGLALFFLHRNLRHVPFADIGAHLSSIPLGNLCIALACTMGSYLALTGYDHLGLRYAGKPLPWHQVAPISFSAFAVGHSLGFATLSGGAIRYRSYSGAGLSTTEIANVVLFCAVTFSLGASLLLGASLIAEPPSVMKSLALPESVSRLAGIVLAAFPLGYILWSGSSARSINIRDWRFAPPDRKVAVGQLVLSVADLCLAAAVIYVLLPGGSTVSYLAFVGIFLLATSAGLLSNVPAGIGVFEGAMLLLLPNVSAGALLGSLLVYRLLYYLIPLGCALVLLTIQELRLRRGQVAALAARGSTVLTKAAPQIIASAVFLAGSVLLFSGSLPAVASRVEFVTDYLPVALLEVSHMISSAIGLSLLILAHGILRRLRGAYAVTLGLLGAGIVVSLAKGFDYEEALILALAAGLLWTSRSEFQRPASLLDDPLSIRWFLNVALVLLAAIWLGLFVHRHVEYSNDLWWTFAAKSDAPRMLRASLVAVVLLAAIGVRQLIRPPLATKSPADAAELAIAKRILQTSNRAETNVVLSGDKSLLIDDHADAFIMYRISGRSGIALGDPVGNRDRFEALTWQFRELCHSLDLRCAFYQVSAVHLPLYLDIGLTLSKLGEEARVPLAGFSLDGSRHAELRRARNRAIRDGASFEVIAADRLVPWLNELKAVSDNWLQEKSTHEKGFSLGTFSDDYLRNFDIAIVRVAGSVVAFANIWKSGDGSEMSIDLMRHSTAAPKGTMDYLLVELIMWAKVHDFAWFNVGMAPLSGLEHHALAPLWHKIGNIIFRLGDEFYNFDGLRRFKEKFDPVWEPRYLAAPGGTELPRVLVDATTLISGGVKGVFSR